jgi:hypothetical protein
LECGHFLSAALLLGWPLGALAQSEAPVFKVDTNLQSIAVQVTDKQGNHVRGLTASDFALREGGQPRKIAFFEAESEPKRWTIARWEASRTPRSNTAFLDSVFLGSAARPAGAA